MGIISVIICTHNPRLTFLKRGIEALKAQSFSLNQWELLLIDNASEHPLRNEFDLSWHPNARYIREEKVGLVHARLCGIFESRGDLLIFLDDDNVLKPDYLAIVREIAQKHPTLGAWGGQILPEYEIPPAKEIYPYLQLLGIRTLSRDIWGNNPQWTNIPMGSGMCVRKEVAQEYYQKSSNNLLHLSVGHSGNRRSCHADTDLAVTSMDIGFGLGLFRALTLTHLIPKQRLNESYLLQLLENSATALVVLKVVRGLRLEEEPRGMARLLDWLRYWEVDATQRKIIAAKSTGRKKGMEIASDLLKKQNDLEKSRSPKVYDCNHLNISRIDGHASALSV